MMLTNPELEGLELKDLQQRYSGAFIHYDGKIQTCRTFEETEPGQVRIWLGRDRFEPFDWKKLNTWRPEPRFIEIDGVIILSTYRQKRQFSRGFIPSQNWSYHFFWDRGGVGVGAVKILEELFKPKPPNKRLDVADKAVMAGAQVLTDNLCYVDRAIWFRRVKIAEWEGAIRGWKMIHPQFKDEVEELTFGGQYG